MKHILIAALIGGFALSPETLGSRATAADRESNDLEIRTHRSGGATLASVPSSGSGIRTKILLLDERDGGDRIREVSQTRIFFDHQRFRLNIRSHQDGHLYVMCWTSQGEAKLLYPIATDEDTAIKAGTSRSIPQRGWYRFDRDPGTERVYVLLSPRPISELDRVAEGSADFNLRELRKYVGSDEGRSRGVIERGIEVDDTAQLTLRRIDLRHETTGDVR